MSFNFLKTQRKFFAMQNYRHATNPRVFMEIAANGKPCGKLVFEVNKNRIKKSFQSILYFLTNNFLLNKYKKIVIR
jgi:hypothetical protein